MQPLQAPRGRMATATMGLRRRVNVNNSPTPTGHQLSASTSASASSSGTNKRTRTENNNSPSHGNLNSLSGGHGAGRDEPPAKKSRANGGTGNSGKSRANSPAVTDGAVERVNSHQTAGKGRSGSGGKSTSRTKSPSITTTATSASTTSSMAMSTLTSANATTSVSNGQQPQTDIASGFNVLGSGSWTASAGMADPTTYTPMSGLNMSGAVQNGLCAGGPLGITPSIPYMATSMATFVGNATNLGKNSSVSYLDISNMTGGSLSSNTPSGMNGSYTCKQTIASADAKGNGLALPFSGVVPANGDSSNAYAAKTTSQNPQQSATDGVGGSAGLKTFQNDTMFNAYQPWVIKTYGDLAKTKTITIKKYARILRTLKGEEVNSAENSKFRFWVKSKGFHIDQPAGYDAKPADRIIGRHAVTSPGLDPPLYVPTQIPHNKVSVVRFLVFIG